MSEIVMGNCPSCQWEITHETGHRRLGIISTMKNGWEARAQALIEKRGMTMKSAAGPCGRPCRRQKERSKLLRFWRGNKSGRRMLGTRPFFC